MDGTDDGNKNTVINSSIWTNLENIVYHFLGNWIAGFRGFKLMEINVATAVFQEDDFRSSEQLFVWK